MLEVAPSLISSYTTELQWQNQLGTACGPMEQNGGPRTDQLQLFNFWQKCQIDTWEKIEFLGPMVLGKLYLQTQKNRTRFLALALEKFYSRWVKDLSTTWETLKLLEETYRHRQMMNRIPVTHEIKSTSDIRKLTYEKAPGAGEMS